MNIDPKILAGAAILGGGALYWWVSSDVVENTIAETNQARWEAYSADMNQKLDDRRDRIMEELKSATGESRERLVEQLTTLNGTQYTHDRYSDQMEKALASGDLDNKSIWGPSLKDQANTVMSSLKTLPPPLQKTGGYAQSIYQTRSDTISYMDPVLADQQNKIRDQYARAQTSNTAASLEATMDPRQLQEIQRKNDRELNKTKKYQEQADAYQTQYNAALNSGAYNQTLPKPAQYYRNQAAAPSTTSPWAQKFGFK